jgi:ferrochelatase
MNDASQNKERVGVLLFNLGGPETLQDVRPFLFNLFSDPDIIRLPWRFMQKPLAWIISTQRYRKSRGYYEKIGGGSPLRRITAEQAAALESVLARRGLTARVYVGMRYWRPFIEEALEEIRRDQIRRLIILPLYPQFSISTTGSSLNRMNELVEINGDISERISVIEQWHDDPGYIDALAGMVGEEMAGFPEEDAGQPHIVFSAHSVPVRYIEEGDPYLDQTRRTVELVMERLGPDRPHTLSFQSKVGPVKWLRPSTDETLRRLARDGCRQVLVVPVSFVSEHSETLYEIDILYRGLAAEIGLPDYRRVSTFNCRPEFIEVLANLVEREISEGRS